MMMNLFSIFDPSTSLMFSLNWMSMFYFLLFIPYMYWIIPSKYLMIWNMLILYLNKEMKNTLKNNLNYYNILFFISLFIFIMLNNFISLFSYIFNMTSHMVISLSISLILWFSFMMFSIIKNMNYMFIHMIPQGTPFLLIPFMVLIESVSNLIRPMTLSIRLSANIIAGHLLMTLMSQNLINLNFIFIILMIIIQSILVILEIAVSFIQSYVFSILSMLYSSETN